MCSQHTSRNRPSLIQVIISLLCFGVQSTPYLAIKRNAKMGLVGLTLVGSLLLAGKVSAKDIEGYVAVNYNTSGIGIYTSGARFIKGAENGLDNFDHAYYEIPFPGDAHVKAVGSIEGVEAQEIAYPPLADVAGSSASEDFSGSIVVNGGKSVTLDNARQYLTWSISGLEGCNVYVNGVNARTNNRLDFENLTGVLTEGEHPTASWNIKVEYVRTNGGDPNTPVEPNQPILEGPRELTIDTHFKYMEPVTFTPPCINR